MNFDKVNATSELPLTLTQMNRVIYILLEA